MLSDYITMKNFVNDSDKREREPFSSAVNWVAAIMKTDKVVLWSQLCMSFWPSGIARQPAF